MIGGSPLQAGGVNRPSGSVRSQPPVERTAGAAAREFEEETGWRPGPMRLLVAMDPMPGISTSHHRVYWSDTAEQVREVPVDEIESARREWVPLERVPTLVERGEVRSANALAALLMLHRLRSRTGRGQAPRPELAAAPALLGRAFRYDRCAGGPYPARAASGPGPPGQVRGQSPQVPPDGVR